MVFPGVFQAPSNYHQRPGWLSGKAKAIFPKFLGPDKGFSNWFRGDLFGPRVLAVERGFQIGFWGGEFNHLEVFGGHLILVRVGLSPGFKSVKVNLGTGIFPN